MRAILRAIPQHLLHRLLPATRRAGTPSTRRVAVEDADHDGKHVRAGTAPVARMTACLLLPVAAAAYMTSAHGATEEEQSKACKSDAIKLCSDDIPNKDKITACMQRKVKQLSPGCRAMFKSSK